MTNAALAAGQNKAIQPHADRVNSVWPEADWPADSKLVAAYDPNIWMVRFEGAAGDAKTLSEIAQARGAADQDVLKYKQEAGIGTTKVFGIGDWGHEAATRLNARALAMAGLVFNKPDHLKVQRSWASIYQPGDWAMPHCHPGAVASLLYMVDPGDDGGDMNGTFLFVDPRIAACCPTQKGFMTHPTGPQMEVGMMMMFPSQILHMVTPYRGTRPRITMSWDLELVSPPEETPVG